MQASIGTPAQSLRTALSNLTSELRADGDVVRSEAVPLVLPVLLLFYVAAMTVFATFVRNWAPMHADATEMAAWGREFLLGYSKHPPLGAWVAGLWFSVMPSTNWSFNLLGTLVGASGLVGVWKLAGLYLDPRAQRLAVLPLMLTPAVTTWAFKYNANSVLLAVWPWAAYFFMRTLQTRELPAAVMAGVFAALALLGKYYSVVLLATFLVVLLVHPARNRVLASPAIYVAALVGALVLAPHLWWLWDNREMALGHAISRTAFDPANARLTTLRSVCGGLLTLVAPIGILVIAHRPGVGVALRRLRANMWSRETWPLIALAWGPLLFTILAYALGGVRIGGEFLLPAFFAVPLLVVMQMGVPVEGAVVRRVTLVVLTIVGAGAMLSPGIGAMTFLNAKHPLLEPRQELADAATDFWRGATNRPLRRVAGQERAATGIVFYSEDHPLYMDGAAGFWFDRTTPEIARDGLLFVCGADDNRCTEHARKVLGPDGYHRFTFTGAHQVVGGGSGPMYTFELYLLPPAQ